ncbi:MAG: TlpA family protein disulfide reductase [Betaproteobacteria bacterium]
MRPGRRKALAFAALGAGAAAAGAFVGALVAQSGSGAAALLAANFTDLEGRSRRVLDWRGHIVLCNFWATWCAPCREEVPLLVAAKQQFSPKRFEVVGIGIDHVEKIREFALNYKVNYPMLVAGAETIDLLRQLGNVAGALPYSVVLDRSGRISSTSLGAFRKDELQRILSRLLD